MKKIFIILITLVLIIVPKAKAIEKSISDYSYGIDARISVYSKYVRMNENDKEDSLIHISETGIYITSGSNYLFIETMKYPVSFDIIDDINEDGTKDIVYSVNGVGDFYNLIAVNGKDGSILWSSKVTEDTYDYTAGFLPKNKSIYKTKIINNDIAVIYDYFIEIFDYKTGKSKFKFEEKNNIWDAVLINDITGDKIADFVISNQIGEVKSFDGKNKKLIWSAKVIPDFSITNNSRKIATVSRNIWQIEFLNNNLYVMGENGTLYSLNTKTGKINNKLSIYEYEDKTLNNYYNYDPSYLTTFKPISKHSKYYKAFEIFPISENKAVITAFVNQGESDSSIDQSSLYDGKPFMSLVDLKKMTEEYKISLNDFKLKNVNPIELTFKDKVIVMPMSLSGNKLIINAYKIEDGEKNETYELNLGSDFSSEGEIKSIHLTETKNNLLLESKGNFSMLVNKNLKSIIKNNNTYSSSNVEYEGKDGLLISYSTNNKINKLVKYSDSVNQKVAWEYNVTNKFSSNGISSISVTTDFNSDGIKDLVALVNKTDKNDNVVASYILVLNMKTGKEITFKSIFLYSYKNDKNKKVDVYLVGNSIYAVKDMTKDKKSELIIDGNIINSSKMSVIGSVNESAAESGRMIKVGDINSDGFTDFVSVGETSAIVYTSKISSNNVSYSKTSNKYSYEKALNNYEYATIVPDLNKDGINEVLFIARNRDKLQYYKILSGKNLKPICNLREEGLRESSSFKFLRADVDDDGYNDLYEMINWGGTYNIISGKTGKNLISFNAYDWKMETTEKEADNSYIIPFYEMEVIDSSITIGSDMNNDGHKEIFFLKEVYKENNETYLYAYDVYNKNSTPIKEIKIENSTQINDGNYFVSNNDIYYEGKSPVYEYSKTIFKVEGNENLYVIKTYNSSNMIYDIKENKAVSGFTIPIQKAKIVNDKMFLLGINNQPLTFDYSNNFKIKNVKDSKTNSPIKYEWENTSADNLSIVKIYDKGKYIKTTYSNSVNLYLSKGEHKLTFESVDRWGKTINQTVTVNISKSSTLIIIFALLAILGILSVLYLSFVTKIRRTLMIRRLNHE